MLCEIDGIKNSLIDHKALKGVKEFSGFTPFREGDYEA